MEQTVQKALNLLEALVRSGQPRRLTELSRELGLTKPNVYRLLSTLSILGYVKKDPATTLYSPTLKLWELGSMMVRDVDLVSVAGPRLRRLCAETHESVQLAVFDSGFVVYVDKVDSPQPLKAMTSIGSRVPASTTSTGKAILAWRVCGIAAPVRDRTQGVVASVGVWGAEKNILGARREELAHATLIAAREISHELGFVEGAPATTPARTTLVSA